MAAEPMTSHGIEYLSTLAPPPRLAPTTGRRPKPCATAQERARQTYRAMWFQANRGRIKGSPSPREEAARAWLEARKQAARDAARAKAANPPAKKRTRRKLSNEGEAEERARQQCRAYYVRHRAKILAERRAHRSRPEVKAARLAKYRADKRRISLVDAVNLCHPQPTPSLTRLMNGTLPSADTWEVALTQAGQAARRESHKVALKRRAWRRLLREHKLGYFALLRNLRNIIATCDGECLALAASGLQDRAALRASLVFPIRIHTALAHLQPIAPPVIVHALEEALEHAFDNVPVLEGRTLVAVDASGSMVGGQAVPPIDQAILFAAGIVKRSRSDVMLFSHDAEFVEVDPEDSIATMSAWLRAHVTACGTNFNAIFERAHRAYDRIIILSDMQAWIEDEHGRSVPTSALARYRRRSGADPYIYAIDLCGYGTSQLPAGKVFQLAGFSEKLFDVIPALEQDREALVRAVEAIRL